jgi:hypothetical protein
MFGTLEVKENIGSGNRPVTSTKKYKIMKRIRFSSSSITIAAVIVFCSVFISCNQPAKELKIITVSGCVFIDNVSLHNAEFGSLADSGETTAIMVSEGDLLYALGEEAGFLAYIVYSEEFGQHLEITMDTAFPGTVRINGKFHSIYLEDNPEYLEWISTLNSEELSDLRFVHVSCDSGKYDLSAIKIIAEANPNIGLSVDELDNPEQFYEILSLFHPSCLILPDIELDHRIDEYILNLDNLEFIYLDDGSVDSGEFLYQLPKLKSLIISGWDPNGPNPIQFEKLSTLKSLTLIESGMNSFAELGDPEQLSALYINGSSLLTNISHLKDLPEIQCLGLLNCDTLTDLSVLKEIPSLQWLSLPPGISQADFDEILPHHTSLKGVELLGCENLTNISSLTQLQELKALTIGWSDIDYNSLGLLTGIELIVIEEEAFSGDEEEIAALKEALPDTHIVPGGGFCMGSGWILLLLPVLLLAFGYRRFIRN